MAMNKLSNVDQNLMRRYADKITTNYSEDYIDRSELLIQQMNFIALNNKSFITFK